MSNARAYLYYSILTGDSFGVVFSTKHNSSNYFDLIHEEILSKQLQLNNSLYFILQRFTKIVSYKNKICNYTNDWTKMDVIGLTPRF